LATISKSQIDRLGAALKKGDLAEAQLRELDEYRRSYHPAYDIVVRRIEAELQLKPTGRPAKSTMALIEKLRRESIRLAQVQDIAGCRITVEDVIEQDRIVGALAAMFEHASVIDRRVHPSYGYRAVHVIVNCDGKLIEVQVRTRLQHQWAELSEKCSDVIDPNIKYGAGPQEVREMLRMCTEVIEDLERMESNFFAELLKGTDIPPDKVPDSIKHATAAAQRMINEQKKRLAAIMQRGVTGLSERQEK
jgi:GTP pyrophosphokinase